MILIRRQTGVKKTNNKTAIHRETIEITTPIRMEFSMKTPFYRITYRHNLHVSIKSSIAAWVVLAFRHRPAKGWTAPFFFSYSGGGVAAAVCSRRISPSYLPDAVGSFVSRRRMFINTTPYDTTLCTLEERSEKKMMIICTSTSRNASTQPLDEPYYNGEIVDSRSFWAL